jgi:hypothetical protein
MTPPLGDPAPRKLGRYTLGGLVATGGMAEVHLGQVRGAIGFSRTVAIKRMHAHLASDPDFASMFADEARLAARVRHPNVVATLDVVLEGTNLCIVMEYIEGVTLAQLLKLGIEQGERMPAPVAIAILRDALEGLHSAHQAVDADGRPLGIVHRDVSPQNVIVGVDGISRVLDFGIAKANIRLHQTREGSGLKGKLAYMAPEQLEGAPVVRQSDVFAASIVLWEALTSQRAYGGALSEGEMVTKILRGPPPPPSTVCAELGTAYDEVLMRGLARAPAERFDSARQMAAALTAAAEPASAAEVGAWVERIARAPLADRAQRVRQLETQLLGADEDAAVAGDPDDTKPASPAGLDDARAVASVDEAANLADAAKAASIADGVADPVVAVEVASPPPSSAVPVVGSTANAAGALRVRVAALVIGACAMTAVAVLAWTSRTPTQSAPPTTPTPAASVAAAPVPDAEAPRAATTATTTVTATATATTATATAATTTKVRKSPPRGTSGVSHGGIPDRL